MIPVFRPCMGKDEAEAVAEVLASGWIGLGPKTERFEKKFAEYIGVRHAVAVNSATAALHLALKVLGVAGGEVVTTPLTFVSTNHAVLYNGAEPVFCDVDPETLCIDPAKAETLVTERTKAVMAVHYGGYPVDMDPLIGLARRRGLAVVEDVAHGCGGEYRGRKLGSIGDIGCFSFNAVKNLATGDGGMVVTNDAETAKRLRRLRWLGIDRDTWTRDGGGSGYSWSYDVRELGFKCDMNDIAAAIGLVQLRKLDAMNARRGEISRLYNRLFASHAEIGVPAVRDHTRPSYHNYVIRCADRDGLNAFLKGEGISTGVHYTPNNRHALYARYGGPTPVCDRVWKTLLTLPLYPDLTDEEASSVASKVVEYVSRRKIPHAGT